MTFARRVSSQRRVEGDFDRSLVGAVVKDRKVAVAEPLDIDVFISGDGLGDRFPARLGHEFAERHILLEERSIAIVELGPGEVGIPGGVVAEEPGKHAVSHRPFHVLLDQFWRKLAEVGVHQETERLALAQCPAVKHFGVRHRPPRAAGVPVGLGAANLDQGNKPG